MSEWIEKFDILFIDELYYNSNIKKIIDEQLKNTKNKDEIKEWFKSFLKKINDKELLDNCKYLVSIAINDIILIKNNTIFSALSSHDILKVIKEIIINNNKIKSFNEDNEILKNKKLNRLYFKNLVKFIFNLNRLKKYIKNKELSNFSIIYNYIESKGFSFNIMNDLPKNEIENFSYERATIDKIISKKNVMIKIDQKESIHKKNKLINLLLLINGKIKSLDDQKSIKDLTENNKKLLKLVENIKNLDINLLNNVLKFDNPKEIISLSQEIKIIINNYNNKLLDLKDFKINWYTLFKDTENINKLVSEKIKENSIEIDNSNDQSKKKNFKESLDNLEKEIYSINVEIKDKNIIIFNMKEDVSKLELDLKKLKNENSNLQAKINNKELNKDKNGEIIKKENLELKEKNDNLIKEIESLENQKKSDKININPLTKMFKKIKNTKELEKKNIKKEVEDMEDKMKILRQKIKNKSNINNLKNEIELGNFENLNEAQIEKINKISSNLENIKNKNDAILKEIYTITNENQSLQEKLYFLDSKDKILNRNENIKVINDTKNRIKSINNQLNEKLLKSFEDIKYMQIDKEDYLVYKEKYNLLKIEKIQNNERFLNFNKYFEIENDYFLKIQNDYLLNNIKDLDNEIKLKNNEIQEIQTNFENFKIKKQYCRDIYNINISNENKEDENKKSTEYLKQEEINLKDNIDLLIKNNQEYIHKNENLDFKRNEIKFEIEAKKDELNKLKLENDKLNNNIGDLKRFISNKYIKEEQILDLENENLKLKSQIMELKDKDLTKNDGDFDIINKNKNNKSIYKQPSISQYNTLYTQSNINEYFHESKSFLNESVLLNNILIESEELKFDFEYEPYLLKKQNKFYCKYIFNIYSYIENDIILNKVNILKKENLNLLMNINKTKDIIIGNNSKYSFNLLIDIINLPIKELIIKLSLFIDDNEIEEEVNVPITINRLALFEKIEIEDIEVFENKNSENIKEEIFEYNKNKIYSFNKIFEIIPNVIILQQDNEFIEFGGIFKLLNERYLIKLLFNENILKIVLLYNIDCENDELVLNDFIKLFE